MCTPPACVPTAANYAVEIATPTGSSVPNLELTDVRFDQASSSFELTLPRVATVHGVVSAAGKYFAGSVVVTRPSRIAGRPDVFYQAEIDSVTGEYTLHVPPNASGETYVVRVRPSDPSALPPFTQQLQVDGDRQLDLAIPSGSDLLQLHGTLVDVLGVAVHDARVVLRDAAQVDLSTAAVTDSQGVFQLLLPLTAIAAASSFTLSVEIGSSTTGLVGLSIEIAPTALKAQLVDKVMKLQLPALPSPTRLSFQLVGSSSAGTDKPVAGAHVRLRSTLVDAMFAGSFRAYHEIEGQTGADGKIDVDLYSNDLGTRTYTVAISPPADSEFQTSTAEVAVGTSSGVSAPIHLVARPVLIGRVLDPGRAPIKGVVLQPSFISAVVSAATSSLATSSKLASATADTDGRFVLRVDAGRYDLGLIPPATAMLPRRWLSSQTVSADLDLGDLVMPVPLQLDGVLKDSTGAPASATIRLYSVPAADAACVEQGADCRTLPHLQAEGATDELGQAHLLLAADGT